MPVLRQQEVPSNLCLQKIRPSLWISFLAVAWGTVMTLMGVVQNYAGLVACRFILGAAEAGEQWSGNSFCCCAY